MGFKPTTFLLWAAFATRRPQLLRLCFSFCLCPIFVIFGVCYKEWHCESSTDATKIHQWRMLGSHPFKKNWLFFFITHLLRLAKISDQSEVGPSIKMYWSQTKAEAFQSISKLSLIRTMHCSKSLLLLFLSSETMFYKLSFGNNRNKPCVSGIWASLTWHGVLVLSSSQFKLPHDLSEFCSFVKYS